MPNFFAAVKGQAPANIEIWIDGPSLQLDGQHLQCCESSFIMSNPRTPSLVPAFILLIVTSTFHLLVAPYTKVEESFTLHAVWDVLTHGRDIKKVSASF
jgi:hypothetical protein